MRKALIEDKGCSRQLLLRCSNDSHPCENLIKTLVSAEVGTNLIGLVLIMFLSR